jgi:hypothetical protein
MAMPSTVPTPRPVAAMNSVQRTSIGRSDSLADSDILPQQIAGVVRDDFASETVPVDGIAS